MLPPLCPVAKGKKVMFAFILEVLNGDGPPFPHEFDHLRIMSWGQWIQLLDFQVCVPTLTQILVKVGHTSDHAMCILACLSFIIPLPNPLDP